jgi:hypothetical protein
LLICDLAGLVEKRQDKTSLFIKIAFKQRSRFRREIIGFLCGTTVALSEREELGMESGFSHDDIS